MIKLATAAATLILALSTSAMAESYNVTEQSVSGIKTAQGVWNLTSADKKITGTATMQFDNGNPLTYGLEGTEDATGGMTLNLTNRSDSKKNCVWTGTPVTNAKPGVLRGDAKCDGATPITITTGH
jgi:hypothetical protein